MHTLWLDLRLAARRLITHRAFTAIAVVTLALGIGANGAIFSLVRAVLLRPLPFGDAERLVSLSERRDGNGGGTVSAHEFAAWRAARHVLQATTMYRNVGFTLTRQGSAELVNALGVTADFFDVLGVPAERGRGFARGEDGSGPIDVAVLSHKLWTRAFNGDTAIVNSAIVLNDRDYRVVGIMPDNGEFDPDLWVPLDTAAEILTVGRHALNVIGRLAAGVTLESAERELNTVAARLERELPRFNTGHRVEVLTIREDVVGDSRGLVLVMMGAVGLVLLIACANVAHLLLTRAAGRRRELAIRTAIGASRSRIVRQLLTESVLLSLAGGVAGLVLASWIVTLLPRIDAVRIPRIAETSVDATVIGAMIGLSLLTGLASGLVPALRAAGRDITAALSDGARNTASAGRRFANAMVVSEVALALVLLVGAGLTLKSFERLTSVNPGFDPDHVLVVPVSLPPTRYPGAIAQGNAFDEVIRRVGTLPGVIAAGATTETPLAACCNGIAITIEGEPPPEPGDENSALLRTATPDYFSALRIPLRSGRFFGPSDARVSVPLIRWWAQQPAYPRSDEPQAAAVAVINETMAKRFWPRGDALGRRFRVLFSEWVTVVGIVGDIRHRGLGAETSPEFFLPSTQEPRGGMTLMVRTRRDPMALAAMVKAELREWDSSVPVGTIQAMDDIVHDSVGRPRLQALVLGVFGALALLLAVVGIYGVISYGVAQRTREIGIRTALGAVPADVLRLIVGGAARLTGLGLIIGLAGALSLTRFLRALLFDVTPTDPPTFIAIGALLAAAALLAAYVPARRAMRIDPLTALRNE